mgnify:CR=1 FL=1
MIIGVVKETKEYENRVALSPEVVKLVRKKGFEVIVESGAGERSCGRQTCSACSSDSIQVTELQ